MAKRSRLALPTAPFGLPRALTPMSCGGPLAILTFLIVTFLGLFSPAAFVAPLGAFSLVVPSLAISLASSTALISARSVLGAFRFRFLTFESATPVFLAFSSVGSKGCSEALEEGGLEGDLKIEALDLALAFALPAEGGRGGCGGCDAPVSISLGVSLGYLIVEAETALIDAATDGVLDLDLAFGLTCGGSVLGYLTVSRELFLARALPRGSAIIIGTDSPICSICPPESGIAASGSIIPVIHGTLLGLAFRLLDLGLRAVLGVPMSKIWLASAAWVGTVGVGFAAPAPPEPDGGGCGGSPTRWTTIALGSFFLIVSGFFLIREPLPPGDGPGPGGPE